MKAIRSSLGLCKKPQPHVLEYVEQCWSRVRERWIVGCRRGCRGTRGPWSDPLHLHAPGPSLWHLRFRARTCTHTKINKELNRWLEDLRASFLPFIHEIMSQDFCIWRDKQTIQGQWQNGVWRDRQNQGKQPVLQFKTRKVNCILQRNYSLDFIQTYTSRRGAILCIFLYMKSLSSEFHRSRHSPNIHHHLPLLNY